MFGGSAVDAFLTANHDSHVFRAHQEECAGIKLCKSARVVTIFSSRADMLAMTTARGLSSSGRMGNYIEQHFKKFPSHPSPKNPLETLRRMVPENNPAK